ncbi:MAG: signal peptide peptidase SppA, partial [Microcystaceae cyanobacterium]
MKAFFKQTLATLLGNLLSLVLTLAVSTTGLLLIVFFLTYDSGPVVKEKSILIVDLATPIQDTEPVFSLGSILSNDQPTPLSLRR